MTRIFIYIFIGIMTSVQSVFSRDYNILDFGAKSDTVINSTEAINNAIDACYKVGGGRVIIPTGMYKSGTIFLKSNTELHFERGSFLYASTNHEDFPKHEFLTYRSQKDTYGWHALIYAEGQNNIAVTGSGTIDGQGAKQIPRKDYGGGDIDGRPRNILFISCSNVKVSGIRMYNSGIWNQHYLDCEDMFVNGLYVYNHSNRNNDGIDIDGCRRLVMSDCIIDSDDDGIVLKSTGSAPCEDITITNCIVSSFCNAIKLGTESTGGFKNISISNCVVKPSKSKFPPVFKTPKTGIAAISLEIVDGGLLQCVSISNISINGTECPLYIRLGNRARKHTPGVSEPPMGILRDVTISNIVAVNTGNFCSSITAIPGSYVENISLSNIIFRNKGGLKTGQYLPDLSKVIEDEKGYPHPLVWGNLPSSGLFIRHAKNININGISFASENEEPRIPIIASDVDGLIIENFGRIENCTAPVFFKEDDSKNISISTPLVWKK